MKVSVVGGGNAGVFTALFLDHAVGAEVELIHDPKIPCERVGQATLTSPPRLLFEATKFNWYDNPIHATFKSGILYEGWGKVNKKVFHDFPSHQMAMHYCPWEMHKHVLNSAQFKVTEGQVDPKDVDADYVFDCRGKPRDYSNYEQLINPTNACILAKPNWDTTQAFWSRHVATPNGWTFVIPTHTQSPSHDYCVGYCYNSSITSKEDAEKNMLEMFDVEVTKHINYDNYVSKEVVIDGRIILNGNRLFFLEPLESSSTQSYMEVVLNFGRILQSEGKLDNLNYKVLTYIKQLQNFVLWHYQFGSKYDTPFWNYAKKLTFSDPLFYSKLEKSMKSEWNNIHYNVLAGNDTDYAQWNNYSIKLWHEGMTHFYKKGTRQ
tara:strand:+ start:47 stop:1177 length:1131 start_codon:yes stop_codon:yes gene_type:complete